MRSARALFCLLLSFISLWVVPTCKAQQDYLLQLGTPPGSPTMPVPMGVVNLKNGNVHLEFPLRTFVQRNGLKLTSKLIYDSSNCYYLYSVTQCSGGWREVYSPFQNGSTPFPPYTQASGNYTQCQAGGANAGFWYTPNTWSNFTFTEATGTSHLMNVTIDNTWLNCTNPYPPVTPVTASGYAMDGSGYFMVVTLSNTNGPPDTTVWDKSGNLMGSGKDTNGNFLAATDELGRSYTPGTMPPNNVGPQQWAGSTIQWESIPIHTNFGGADANGPISTISSITLPDGRSYQFTYDQGTTPGYYGQIIGMTLPTGGQVSFSYTNIPLTPFDGPDRRLASLSQGGATWNFTYNITYNPHSPPSSPSATTVTAPPDSAGIQNQSVYSFTAPCLGPNATTPWSAKYYSGAASGTPLRENDVVLDCTGARVLQETKVLENGMSSKVVWNYQSNNINMPGSSNITSKQEYDFSGGLARETTASYQTSTTYTGKNITDRPLTVKVYGAGGAASGPLMAQTNYSYDSTTLSTTSGSAGNSVVGATGHDDPNYGTGNTVRGNLTSVSQMISSGNFITTKTNYYNTLGELIQTTDGKGNSTLFDFTDKWASGTGSCVPGSTFAYPTTITYPGTVTNKNVTTYGACDGFVYSLQDQNDLNASRVGTVYSYDGLQRVTNVSFPDGGSEQTNYGGTATPQIITKTKALTSTSSITSNSTLDGLGRATQTVLTSDPDGTTYTATTFDNLGRTYQVYNPTRCNPPTTNCNESTWGVTTYSYDALGRATKVIPPDGSASSNNVSTAYSGNSATVTDQTGKPRKSVADALGRLVEVDEPSAAGLGIPGQGSVTIGGSEQSITQNGCPNTYPYNCWYTIYDGGGLQVTVNGLSKTVSWGSGSTANSLASAVASAFNSDSSSSVTASASNSTVTFTAKTTGSATNYSLSASVTGWNSTYFSSPSFGGSTSGSTLTGGSNTGVSFSNPFVTLYTYNALDNLLAVTQKGGSTTSANWRPRTFTYDGLSRLTSSINPESNTIPTTGATLATTYAYDANGNLSSKTSPAPNQTGSTTVTLSYCYDALNRITSKSYTAQSCPMSSPLATYVYDQNTNGIGRRTSMTDSAGSESWTYDSMGRVLSDQRTTNALTKSTIYAYLPYLDGSLNTITYPSGRVMTYATGTAERPLSTQDNSTSVFYASGVHYTPPGALSSLVGGASLASTFFYDTRLQPCRTSVRTTGNAPSNCADSINKGNILDFSYSFNLGSADNGNVASITNNRDNTRSQNFSYDNLNRIATAQTQTSGVTIPNSNCWGLTFNEDSWGNLLNWTNSAPSGCSGPLPLNVAVTTSNRINTNTVAGTVTNFCYDSAGNLIHSVAAPSTCPTSGPYQYTYNAENQLVSTAGITYTYDGDGKRVQKSNGKLYWYGGSSDPLDETDAQGNTNNSSFNEYVFLGGKRIARRDSSNNVFYYFADHLGTSRNIAEIASGQSTATLCYDADFYPFGGERIVTDTCDSAYKFTGKERDSESGLDNFEARYLSSSLGRFMSADPIFIGPARLIDPQGLNLYAYVRNNPLNLTDPSGLDFYLACQTADHKGCGEVQNGSEKIWVQGQTVNGKFEAYDIDMNRDGSGLYSDQFGHDYKGTFDQKGVSFTSVDQGGASGGGRFISGSDETDVNGSGIFSGLQGKFVSDCGGSCQARGSLYELQPGSGALGRAEAALQLQSNSWSKLDRLSGAHAEGRQWMDDDGLVHVVENVNGINAGKTELHFEGHPNKGVSERSQHLWGAFWDLVTGRAKEQKDLKLP